MDPILLDMGTGLRFYGESVEPTGAFHGLALVSHLHWDHVQGLPFFVPINRVGSSLVVCGHHDEGSLQGAFDDFMRPPYFPVTARDLNGDIEFKDFADGEMTWGRARILARDVPHTGATNGYRIELDGVSIAYVSDHQEPVGSRHIAPSVLELCEGADLVIHDAQYEPHEFHQKADWGHCTVEYAVRVAAEAGARRLALFHHDPGHDDAAIDRMLVDARRHAEGTSLQEVIAASEGLTVSLSLAPVTA
jgi:phosphoribosyl 1,2-cyclic phosphodiesterase